MVSTQLLGGQGVVEGGYADAATGRGKRLGVAATDGADGCPPGWQCRACECSQRLPVKPAGHTHT